MAKKLKLRCFWVKKYQKHQSQRLWMCHAQFAVFYQFARIAQIFVVFMAGDADKSRGTLEPFVD